ncbi:hypothetical protein JCM16106_10930 [Hydrogenophilus islandicus]
MVFANDWSSAFRRWLLPGDWFALACGIVAVAASLLWLTQAGAPTHAVVRVGGKVVGTYPLDAPRSVQVVGPLGETVVEIAPGRARVLRDPSPRQLCVRQGWLTRAGSVAICAPNEVSVELTGRERLFDSLNF